MSARDWREEGDWIDCPRCERQMYDVGSCNLCGNVGILDANGERFHPLTSRAAPPVVRRRRRRVSVPQEWPLYLSACVLAIALGLAVGWFA